MDSSDNSVLVFRNVKTQNWSLRNGHPHKINPKDHVGYRYYRSFPDSTAAQHYCQSVEADETAFNDHL